MAGRALGVLVVTVLAGIPGLLTQTPATAQTPYGCPSTPLGVHDTAPGSGRTVALTFDDGPGRDTAKILAELASAHVTATFFNLGANEAADHSIVRTEAARYPVGNHTWDHQSLLTLDATGQAREMDRASAVQASLTGALPCLFRPPFGSFDATTLSLAGQRHMQVWNWSVDTEDWKAAGSGDAYWVDRIRSRAEAGGSQQHPVVLMHNQPAGNPATVAALPAVIHFYKVHGYRFVDVLGNTGPPVVSTLSTASGPTVGGARMTVRGTGLRGVLAVRFGRSLGSAVQVLSATKLLVTTPRHAAGRVEVQVVTDHGTSSGGPRFRFVAPPLVSRVTPSTGRTSGGSRVRVDGANFVGATFVRFGTSRGTAVRIASGHRLYVTAPAHAAGRVDVRVQTAFGRSATHTADHFTFIAPPRVTGLTPSTVSTVGGDQVTIRGSGFRTNSTVRVGGTAATTFTIASSTTIMLTVPPHVAGAVYLVLRNGYGSSVPVAITYVAPPPVP